MEVIGVGALNFDRIYSVDRLAESGTHQPILAIHESPGGSSANTIAALGRLGHRTGFVGLVGNDVEGRVILKDFGDYDVDVSHVRTMVGRSGLILCFVDSKGERTMYPHPGVNNMVEFSEADVEYCNSAKIVHLSSYVGDRQFREQCRLIGELEKPTISFTPGDLYARKGLKALFPMLEKCSILFLNRSEHESLTGAGIEEGASILHDTGVQTVVVTLGDKGSFISSKGETVSVGVEKSKVVDTTGAGDAYAAGFLSGVLKEKNLRESAEMGSRLASECIKKFGARW